MSTSQKHADFVRDYVRDKPIGAVAGIGDKAAEILIDKGYEKAYHLLGKFLLLGRSKQYFDMWLQREVTSMNSVHRENCVECLSEWCRYNF